MLQTQQVRERIQCRLTELGKSRDWFAQQMDLDPSTISRYLSGERPLTPEFIRRASVVLSDLILRKVWAITTEATILPTPVLDNVDSSPLAVLLKLREETTELTAAIDENALINVRNARDLSPEGWQRLERLLDQATDAYTCIEQLFLSCYSLFGVEPQQAVVRWSRKVRGKGYIKGRGGLPTIVVAESATGGGGVA